MILLLVRNFFEEKSIIFAVTGAFKFLADYFPVFTDIVFRWLIQRFYSESHVFSRQTFYILLNLAEFNITSDGWYEWRGNQYYLNRHHMYMEEARHFCQQRHGDLVSISSKDENTFLWKQVNIYKFSVGANI